MKGNGVQTNIGLYTDFHYIWRKPVETYFKIYRLWDVGKK